MAKEKASKGRYIGLVLCGGGFAVGILCGCLYAAAMTEGDLSALRDHMTGYGAALEAGAGMAGFGALLWNGAKWPLFVFLLGFTALGVVLVPLTFAARGFLLSYCAAGLVRAMAGRGALLALLFFGMEGIVTLPVFFILGTQSLAAARDIRGRLFALPRQGAPILRGWQLRSALCMLLLVLSLLAERFALPPLIRAAVPVLINS